MKLNQRFSHGLQFLASYTFGKSLDYARLARLGRRRRRRPAERDALRREPGALGLRRQAPLRAELGVGAAVRRGPRDRERRHPEADPRELAVQRHRHALDRTAVHGLPEHRRQQRRAVVAGPHRRRQGSTTRPSTCGSTRPRSRRRRPTPTATSGRGVLYAPGTQTVDVSLSRTFPIKMFRLQFRADAFNLFNTPQFGFPNANIGSPTVGRITSTIGRQPLDAVRAQAGLVAGEPEGRRLPGSLRGGGCPPQARWRARAARPWGSTGPPAERSHRRSDRAARPCGPSATGAGCRPCGCVVALVQVVEDAAGLERAAALAGRAGSAAGRRRGASPSNRLDAHIRIELSSSVVSPSVIVLHALRQVGELRDVELIGLQVHRFLVGGAARCA